MPNFQIIHFIPPSREAIILNSPVRSIIAVPHTQNAGTNHWSKSYSPEHSPPRWLQRIHGYFRAAPYLCAPDAQAQFKLHVPPNLKVKDVYNLLMQNDRHKYEFDSAGVGCRYWVTDQLGLLQHQGLLVDPEEVTAAKNGIVLLWPDQTPLPLDQGAYYQ
ncbi:hypothetical protein AtubIFM55763_009841 [Aspergillus tubingensis]|uniref:DUF7770 domain-containing protein n=1 Tax=Aspergillus tubingensis TaxID=5068 RepID=A0A9W6AI02_ASPTU|nr:hypothetical protein AtubIFM54640_004343 [Aspergillus tubingensis]GLA77651.1 hypothetical protein AtubIFM55763_009841 [Aspergillus tubingensis]GLA82750.1 hypothetical protein AtubIFM56815_006940 [Aspergillus tubingensis]